MYDLADLCALSQCSSGPGTHKSSSETNLSALAGGPYQPSFSVSASSSASSSNDQLNLTDGNGRLNGRL